MPLILVSGFAGAIALGTLLLVLPWASEEGTWTSPVTAFFVTTSAVCVTGLAPVDTASHWSHFGEAVILVLIQFGGLGFMASTTLLFLLFGWRVGVRERLFLSSSLDLSRPGGIVRLTRRAILFTFIFESVGFVLLSVRFAFDQPVITALWHGLFNSISAFNNAGFDLSGNSTSLEGTRDVFVLAPIGALVIAGGIGYLVFEDLLQRRRRLSLDSTLVLWTTAGLILVSWPIVSVLEWDGALAGLSFPDKLLQAGFHAASSRTSGFATLPVGDFREETQVFTMALMFIGGASGSTAGGIKVATFAILVATVVTAIRGRAHIEVAGREIRRSEADKALAVAALGIMVVFSVSVLLAILEEHPFLALLFEVVSAAGTTGLSTGITADHADPSLILLSVTMFMGRLGPLTLALLLVQRGQPDRIRLPEERVRIG
ncbi:MAG: TrkH family potassium uptake protein [Dehalococcoidia bacterium]